MYIDLPTITKTTVEWQSSSVVLAEGQIGIEVTTTNYNRYKRGNGSSLWNALPYVDTIPPANITGIVGIANGGTGATTAAGALSNLGISGIFSRVTYGVRDVSISAGADNTQIFNVYRTGYTAIAVSSFYLSFTRTPCIYRTYLSADGKEARISVSNNGTTAISGIVQVEILYVKN